MKISRVIILLPALLISAGCIAKTTEEKGWENLSFEGWKVVPEASDRYQLTLKSPSLKVNEKKPYCFFVSARLEKNEVTGKVKPLQRQISGGNFVIYYHLNDKSLKCDSLQSSEDFFWTSYGDTPTREHDFELLEVAKTISTSSWVENKESYVAEFSNEGIKSCLLSNDRKLRIYNVSGFNNLDENGIESFNVDTLCTSKDDSWRIKTVVQRKNSVPTLLSFFGVKASEYKTHINPE